MFQNSFYSEILGSIEYYARLSGYHILISATDANESYLTLAKKRNLDGIIVIGMYPDEFYQQMKKTQIPIVLIDSYCGDHYYHSIRIDDAYGSYLAAKYVLSRGHREIAFFCGQIKDIMTGYRAFSYQFVKTYPVLSRGFEIETEMTIHALHRNMQVENVIIDYRDRPAGSESKLNTYSDGFRVLRTIARLYKNYRPFGFFSTLAAVLGMISLCFLAPVLGEYFATGLVPRFPTLIVCACVLVAALLLFISGVILSSQLTKDDRDFEFHLQQVQQWKNRSADPFSHSAK